MVNTSKSKRVMRRNVKRGTRRLSRRIARQELSRELWDSMSSRERSVRRLQEV